jgi:2-amino-4-hydroxy-6-hydroxymethyldihydropteridine diphosphokinase
VSAHQAWLSLGANIGDPAAQLADAVERLAHHEAISVTARSTVIRTKPWGKLDQPDFANMAVAITTTLSPQDLLAACLAIEAEMGRTRIEVWGPRLIDIDIIAYERLEMTSQRLTIPHPHAHDRDFVLDPLGEIAPDIALWIRARQAPGRGSS